MVRLCDEALRSPGRFDRHQGLAGADVQIADPAVGSGTFLLALLRHIADRIEADQGPEAVGPALTRWRSGCSGSNSSSAPMPSPSCGCSPR